MILRGKNPVFNKHQLPRLNQRGLDYFTAMGAGFTLTALTAHSQIVDMRRMIRAIS